MTINCSRTSEFVRRQVGVVIATRLHVVAMNFYQSFNVAIFCLTLTAVFNGVNKRPGPIEKTPVTIWIFVAFVVLLRLKMCLDDHKYFGVAATTSKQFKVGFLVGAASWIFWILSAWAIPSIQSAYFFAGLAITISSFWIVVTALRAGGAYREQYIWIATNAVFVILLWAAYRRNSIEKDAVTWGVLGAALLFVIVDMVFSRSIPELDKDTARTGGAAK